MPFRPPSRLIVICSQAPAGGVAIRLVRATGEAKVQMVSNWSPAKVVAASEPGAPLNARPSRCLLVLLIAFNTDSIGMDERSREHATMMAFACPLAPYSA